MNEILSMNNSSKNNVFFCCVYLAEGMDNPCYAAWVIATVLQVLLFFFFARLFSSLLWCICGTASFWLIKWCYIFGLHFCGDGQAKFFHPILVN
jgi:hypothetical protein